MGRQVGENWPSPPVRSKATRLEAKYHYSEGRGDEDRKSDFKPGKEVVSLPNNADLNPTKRTPLGNA